MNNEQITFDPDTSIEENCLRFGKVLGLDEPVSEAVLLSATQEPTYAHNLLVCRGTPEFMEFLLKNPPYKPDLVESTNHEKSNVDLLTKVSKAMWRWSKTGFSTVDEETHARRFGACQECPHLVEPPKKLLYKLAKTKGSDSRICRLCGCFASRKARLPIESCPLPHPSVPSVNRWGEPLKVNG